MYTIEQLSIMTGLTDRTLRNYLKSGILRGEKEKGAWKFSEEQVEDFMAQPSAAASILAKHNAILADFQTGSEPEELCVLLDRTVSRVDAGKDAAFFCQEASEARKIRFSFRYEKGRAHFVLKGPENEVRRIMDRYYGR